MSLTAVTIGVRVVIISSGLSCEYHYEVANFTGFKKSDPLIHVFSKCTSD